MDWQALSKPLWPDGARNLVFKLDFDTTQAEAELQSRAVCDGEQQNDPFPILERSRARAHSTRGSADDPTAILAREVLEAFEIIDVTGSLELLDAYATDAQ